MQIAHCKRSHPDQGFQSRMTTCSRRQTVKLYTLFKTLHPENHTLLSGTYPFRPNKRVPPPPKGVNHQRISLWFYSDFPEISFRLAYRKRQNSLGALSLREQPACLWVRVDPLLNKTRERYLLTSHALCCRCIKILQSSTCEIRGPGNFSARIYISKSKSVIRLRSF